MLHVSCIHIKIKLQFKKLIIFSLLFFFQVHIKFQNAEPLIEKFNLDLFERYDLAKETILNSTKTNKTIMLAFCFS